MPLSLRPDWVPPSIEEQWLLDEEEAADNTVGITEEERDYRGAMRAPLVKNIARLSPFRTFGAVEYKFNTALRKELPDWNPKGHTTVRDVEHGYVQISYRQERPRPWRVTMSTLSRLTVTEAWDEQYATYVSTVHPGKIFEQNANGQARASERSPVVWLRYEEARKFSAAERECVTWACLSPLSCLQTCIDMITVYMVV